MFRSNVMAHIQSNKFHFSPFSQSKAKYVSAEGQDSRSQDNIDIFFFFVTDNIDIHRHIYIPSNNTNSYLPSFTIFFSNLQPPIFTIYHIGNASYSLRKQKKIGSIARKSSNSYPYIYNTIYPFLFFFCFPSIFIYHLNL